MDAKSYERHLAELSELLKGGDVGYARTPLDVLMRVGAITAGQVIVWGSAHVGSPGPQLDVVVFTKNAVVRAVRNSEPSGGTFVTAFPRSELRVLSVDGGDHEAWGDMRDPYWPPDGRVLAQYENGVQLGLPLFQGPLPKHVRESFGQFLPSLFSDLGRNRSDSTPQG
ncbi:hypothetical protein [Micromonospora sp. NPDC048839]|uniref:hypothetical protein n=1 Tax=Micromonospora sp. NPDC048839 TaxID=3155641 RepID=UPI0033DCB0A0